MVYNMTDRQEFFGYSVDLDEVSTERLRFLRRTSLDRIAECSGYVAVLDFKLLQRDMNPLPFEDEDLAAYAEVADDLVTGHIDTIV